MNYSTSKLPSVSFSIRSPRGNCSCNPWTDPDSYNAVRVWVTKKKPNLHLHNIGVLRSCSILGCLSTVSLYKACSGVSTLKNFLYCDLSFERIREKGKVWYGNWPQWFVQFVVWKEFQRSFRRKPPALQHLQPLDWPPDPVWAAWRVRHHQLR